MSLIHNPQHDIVICTLNRYDSLNRLLKSLSDCTDPKSARIIIIDSTKSNKNRDKIAEFICKTFHVDSLVVYFDKGLPSCRNKALEFLQSPLVHFLDDDITVESNYLQSIDRHFKQFPEISGTGPLIENLYKKKEVSFLSRAFSLDPHEHAGKLTKSGRNFWIPDLPETFPRTVVDWIPGCSMIFRSHILSEFQFNTNLEKGPGQNYALGEDVDFGWRVSRKYKLDVTSEVKIQHHLESSKRDNKKLMLRASGVWLAYLRRLTAGHVSYSRIMFEHTAIYLFHMLSYLKSFSHTLIHLIPIRLSLRLIRRPHKFFYVAASFKIHTYQSMKQFLRLSVLSSTISRDFLIFMYSFHREIIRKKIKVI